MKLYLKTIKYIFKNKYLFLILAGVIFSLFLFSPKKANAAYASGGYWLQCWAGSTCACGVHELATGIYNNGNNPNGSINMIYCQNEVSNSGAFFNYDWSRYNYRSYGGWSNYYCDSNSWMYAVNLLWTGATQGFHCIGLGAGGSSANWGGSEYFNWHGAAYDADICASGYGSNGIGDYYAPDGIVDNLICRNINEPMPVFNYFYTKEWNSPYYTSPAYINVGQRAYIYWSANNANYVQTWGYPINGYSYSPNSYTYVDYTTPGNYAYAASATGSGGTSWAGYWSYVYADPGTFILYGSSSCNGQNSGNNLSWTASAGIEGGDWYYIYRSMNGSGYQYLTRTNGNQTSYSDNDASYGNTYRYYVMAYDSASGRYTYNSSSSGTSTADYKYTFPITINASCCSSPKINFFNASPASIKKGQSSSLSWTTQGGVSATLSPNPGCTINLNGSCSVSPEATQTYTLQVNGICGGIVQGTAQVSVEEVIYKGSFIAGNISINTNRDYIIKLLYDPRILEIPPPGFSDIFAPIFKEIAP